MQYRCGDRMLTPDRLRSCQKRAALSLLRRPAFGLLMDMGLGKTVSTLSAIKALRKRREIRAACIVAPLRVVETVWKQEAHLWAHTRRLKFSVVRGNENRRLDALRAPADIYLINYELLPWLSKLKPDLWPFDMLVLDESDNVKSASSERFKGLRYRMLKHMTHRAILTGTPTPNSLLDIWSQIYVLDDGARLGTSFNRFKERFFRQTDYYGYRWEPYPQSYETVMRLISDITLRLDNKDWIELPDLIEVPVPVVLPSAARELYDEHEERMFIALSEDKYVEAVSRGVLTMQCQQIANGAVYDDEEDHTSWTHIHDAKIDALREILRPEPTMVAYWFRHDLERLRAAFPEAAVMTRQNTAEIVRDWNKGKLPLLFVHPRAASHGLNMQFSGNVIVFFSLNWSFGARTQFIHRIRRPGQTSRKVYVKDIYAVNTVDELIREAWAHKDQGQRALLDGLRAYHRRRHGTMG